MRVSRLTRKSSRGQRLAATGNCCPAFSPSARPGAAGASTRAAQRSDRHRRAGPRRAGADGRASRCASAAVGSWNVRVMTDPLTGLLNRRGLRALVGSNAIASEGYAVVICDIDNFKRINDVHGHDVGDLVLVETARRLRAELRPEDSAARWGGEEFLLVLGISTVGKASIVAERAAPNDRRATAAWCPRRARRAARHPLARAGRQQPRAGFRRRREGGRPGLVAGQARGQEPRGGGAVPVALVEHAESGGHASIGCAIAASWLSGESQARESGYARKRSVSPRGGELAC